MTRKLLLIAILGLAAAPSLFAQIDPIIVEYNWGGIHAARSQVVALNIAIDDACSTQGTTAEVTLMVYDKTGKTVLSKTSRVMSGQTFTFALGPDDNSARTVVGADMYLVLPATPGAIIPCVKVAFPPGPCRQPIRLVTPTMETLDATTGRLTSFAGSPHAMGGSQ